MKTIRLTKILLTAFISLLFCAESFAQDVERIQITDAPFKASAETEAPKVLHITDRINQMPSALRAYDDFQQNKARRAGVVNKSRTPLQPGMRVTFRVLKNLVTNPTWEEREFVLKASSNLAAIWVDSEQLNLNHVTDADIAALEGALLNETPDASVDPGQGIVAINNTYFGAPPDVDGDGQLDILLYDIEEGVDDSNSFIAGFVTTDDLSTFGGGNMKDILYLDTDPGIRSRPITSVLATAAHEYQHLIHFNYDRFETTFTNEGLSEWAEVLNGYPARSMTFLRDPSTYNVRLFGWETGDNILDDYRRAGLFTGYMAERAPAEAVASLTRNSSRSRAGYEEMLTEQGLDFQAVLMDYHTANLLNSDDLDPAFAYSNPTYNSVQAITTVEYDGRATDNTPLTTTFIEAGSVEYLVWRNVSEFKFSLDAIEQFETIRNRIRVRALLTGENGVTRFEDLTLPQTSTTFSGTYDEIILMVVHVQPELTSRVGISYGVSWINSTEGSISNVTYDDGQVASQTFFSLSAAANGGVATRFDLSDFAQAQLLEVQISPYFLSQFSNTDQPSDAPRDMTLTVWDVGTDGKPGDVLFSRVVDDPRAFANASSTLNHFNVDLEAFESQLSELPEAIFIGYTEAGTDENFMVVGPSTYAPSDLSYVTRSTGAWGALWETQFSDSGENEFPLSGMVIPVRAVFEVSSQPVSSEDDFLLPDGSRSRPKLPKPI